MSLYILSYDLRKSRSYRPLLESLKSLNAVRVFENTWCFQRNNTTAGQMCDYLIQLVDRYDGLIVSEVTDWASSNTDGDPNNLA